MSDKTKIDRLFQERFKDFEVTPNDQVWQSIHENLHKKKNRKIIPFYWKLAGIAAAIIILLFTIAPLSTFYENEPAVVDAPKETDVLKEKKLNKPIEIETGVAFENKDKSNELKKSTKNNSEKVTTISPPKTDRIINDDSRKVANASDKKRAEKLATVSNISENETESVAIITNSNEDKMVASANNKTESKEQIGLNQSISENSVFNHKDIIATEFPKELNPLEEIRKKKNEEKIAVSDEKTNRWQLSTNVAPVFFNSASTGSPIESQFAQNSKSYEENLSVGVGVQYALNKKVALRTGINKLTLGYNTNDIVFFGALNASGVSNFSSNAATSSMKVISASNEAELKPFSDNLQNAESGILNQQMGYYEVPFEISYAIIDRKFGINVIGGMSTLFLNENSVSVQSATTSMSLGQATNLNDIHFSGNLGIGLKYTFLKNLEANFEPTFKYQLNTFSRDAGNFRPYFIGLYTGISLKF